MKSLFIVVSLLAALNGFTQYYKWNQLAIALPDGWSTKTTEGALTYSNYNLQPAQLQSFTLFPAQPFSGKPDTLFPLVWKSLTSLSELTEIPRWKRLNTVDGILLLQGGLQTGSGDDTRYFQLNVFILEMSYQACLLETTDLKTFKIIQPEWQDRLIDVRKLSVKK